MHTGIIPAVVSPFDANGEIDFSELRRLITHLRDTGVHGIFIVSNAGEFHSLDEAEKVAILKVAKEVCGTSTPIYFGSGSNTTRESIRLTQLAENGGASAVSIITPHVIKPSDDELFEHYRAIAESTALPVLVYNNPLVTGVTISGGLARRLSAIDNLVGIKDSSGNFALTLEFLDISPDFSVLAGRDGLILSTLAHGGGGAISSVACAFPTLALGIYENFRQGNFEKAKSFQKRFARLRQTFELGSFPSVIKKALEIKGFKVGRPRAPISELNDQKTAVLRQVILDAENESL